MAVIDTLKLAKRLEAAGMPQRQAEEVSAALGEAIGEGLVTREYFDASRTADHQYLDARFGAIEAARTADRQYLDARFGTIEAARTADREYVDLRLNEMETRLQRRIDQVVIRLGSLIIVVVGLAAALTHLLH